MCWLVCNLEISGKTGSFLCVKCCSLQFSESISHLVSWHTSRQRCYHCTCQRSHNMKHDPWENNTETLLSTIAHFSASKHEAAEENVFVHQTLEDFYQAVENVQRGSRKSRRPSHISRAKSAPAADTARASQQAPAEGRQLVRSAPTVDIQPGPGPDNRSVFANTATSEWFPCSSFPICL